MSNLKQKFNSLIHRHPWALQTALALVIAMGTIGVSTYSTSAADLQVELDFSVTGVALAPHDNPTQVGNLLDLQVDLAFIDNGLPGPAPVDLYAGVSFYNSNQIGVGNPQIGVTIERISHLTIADFGGQPTFTATITDIPILARYAYIKTWIDYSPTNFNGLYPEANEINNRFPDNLAGAWFEVPNFQDIAILPQIDSVTPSPATVNSIVTITGTNFGDTIGQTDDVRFTQNGVAHPTTIIQNWTATEIQASVPTGLVAGAAGVTVTTADGTSNSFDITIEIEVGPSIGATYLSQEFNISQNGVGPVALYFLKANYHQSTDLTRDVDFGITFLNASGAPVWTNADSPDSFDQNGYLRIGEVRESELTSTDGYALGWLQNMPKFAQVRSIQIMIIMSTTNFGTDDPWVQSVTFQYEAATSSQIGVINFVDTAGNDGTVTKTIARGSNGSFNVRVTPLNGFTGQALLQVGAITKVGGTNEDVTGKILAVNLPQTINIPAGVTDVTATVTFSVNNDTTLSGVYQFELSGYDVQNSNAVLVPNNLGRINVGEMTGPFSLSIAPATADVIRGQNAIYNISLTRASDFTGTVTLTDNVETIFGTGVTGTLSDSTLSGTDTGSVLTITTTNSATLTNAQTFTINGSSTGQTDQIATAQLAIISADTAITLNLTIPIEGGKPTDSALPHPRFDVRVYNGLAHQLVRTGLTTNAQNRLTIVATRDANEGLPNGSYTIYARSTRHLWGKSTVPATLVIDSTHATYDITFPTLKAGDLDANNKVNINDSNVEQTWAKYGQTLSGFIGDLNNDGKINIGDISYITNFNYGLWGDQLPDETR